MKGLFFLPLVLAFQVPAIAQTGAVPEDRPAIRPPSALHGWADWERGKKIFEKVEVPPAPVLSPQEELATFRVAPGYRVELVACEPLVANPHFFEFDAQGRIWALEYRGYMRDLQGRGEADPICRLVVLEDTDDDGTSDRSTVYLDGLVMPRSFAFVEGGVLLAEPPHLWYCRDTDGDLRCDEKKKVGTYGVAGNPQHTANGLRRGIDHWLHSADWPKRHRFRDGQLVVEDAIHRGQFGVSFDDLGRFYTCHESTAARADYLPAEYMRRNPSLLTLYHRGGGDRERFGIGVHISRKAQEVFPIRPTPQITLGGLELRDDGTLRTYTVVAGTCVYRGDQFPEDARGNLFVPESGGHLIGRLVLEGDLAPQARRFYPAGQELLASTDERFRPVNARTGPDGALYIADLYKGIIEHVIFMVPWISDQVKARNLEEGNDRGRIWRVVYEGRPISRKPPQLSHAGPAELVNALNHPNGWWRDTAQRLLVDGRPAEAIPHLKDQIANGASHLGRMHALWTLEGMGALDWKTCLGALHDNHPFVRATALRVLERIVTPERESQLRDEVSALVFLRREENPHVLQQAILTLGVASSQQGALDLFLHLLERRPDALGRTAILSGVAGREAEFLQLLLSKPADADLQAEHQALIGDLQAMISLGGTKQPEPHPDLTSLTPEQIELIRLGEKMYAQLCASCHQLHGQGAPDLAPPLGGSEWVNGPPERLAQIVLRGLFGPIEVRGQSWNRHMPGFGAGSAIADREFAAILTFIRRSWGNRAQPVTPELVRAQRAASAARVFPWTAEELAGKAAPAPAHAAAAIAPGGDGQFVLQSKAARLLAHTLRYHPDLDIIGPWVVEADAALWHVDAPAAGSYRVHLHYAMDAKNAGNTYLIETDLSALKGKVASTGGFDQFREVQAGTLELQQGINRMLMRPAGAPKGELIDLRSIRLVPVRPR